MKNFIYSVYLFLFARPFFRKWNELLLRFGMKGLGLLNHQSFEASGEAFLLKTILQKYKPKNIFDVGANEGDYAQACLKLGYQGQIYCFEPHPKTFARLQQKFAQQANIQCVNKGLSAQTQTAVIYDHASAQGSEHATLYADTISQTHKSQIQQTEIQLISFDQWAKEAGIDNVDFFKIDIEGHELSALQGAKEWIETQKIAIMQIEFGETNIASRTFFRDIRSLLAPNYRLYRLLPQGVLEMNFANEYLHELFAFQNLVAVRKDINLFA